jgi:ribosomal protein S18 acetylase RimI-like enzyme
MATPAPGSEGTVVYGPIQPNEIDRAAQIFVETFPDRVALLFSRTEPAIAFYADLFELVRRAYGDTFFAARTDDRLVGFLAMTEGTQRLLRAGLKGGYLARTAVRAVTGRYGSGARLARRLVASLAGGRKERAHGFDRLPQVYVIATESGMTGRGIGSTLLALARTAWEPRVDRIWLRVEAHNDGAIRLYEKVGFRLAASDATENIMVWSFDGSAP